MSFLNGLSALGASTASFAGTAGLEAQKADLAKQSMMLADQLATAREVNVTQPFQAGQQALAQAGETTRTGLMNQTSRDVAASQAASAANVAGIQGATQRDVTAANNVAEMLRTTATNNADPPEVKLLRALGVPLAGSAAAPGNAPTAPANTSTGQPGSGAAAPPSTSGSATPGLGGSGTSPSSAPTAGMSPSNQALINKTLGLPQPGSGDALRRGVAADVAADPDFRDKTPGQQAMETEKRVAVASGKMTDPDSRALMAQGIANYQISPLSGYSLTKPGGPETMAQVMKLNPDYQESRFPEVNKAMAAFGAGPQGNIIRANDVGFQHLAVIDQAASALGNTNVGVVNTVKNAFQAQFGAPAPTTFNGLKQIVATEVEKAVAGGIGSSADRDRSLQALNSANSPAQLQAMTNGFRSLMVGQLSGLKTQYEQATGITTGPFAFNNKLAPQTRSALESASHGNAAGATPSAADSDAPMTGMPTYGVLGSMYPATPRPGTGTPASASNRPPAANPDLQRLWGQ